MAHNNYKDTLFKYLKVGNISRVVILADKNVNALYPDEFSFLKPDFDVIKFSVPAGEASKSIETAVDLWRYLIDNQCDKNTFLINFGGGSVCDLGGFVASTYKRGIRFANVPTTLLAMIDASIGGKTAIDFNGVKNSVGTFYFPEIQLYANLYFLKTLPREELESGIGEMVKYALVGSEDLFAQLTEITAFRADTIRKEWIDFCVSYKMKIVGEDPYDSDLRRILNFGHTVGHAIEALRTEQGKPIPHGVAVAQGIFFESNLSRIFAGLSDEYFRIIENFITKNFKIPSFTEEEVNILIKYMMNDKKNGVGKVNFTLLRSIGHVETNHQLSIDQILLSLKQ